MGYDDQEKCLGGATYVEVTWISCGSAGITEPTLHTIPKFGDQRICVLGNVNE
jgi:hypothetical protein